MGIFDKLMGKKQDIAESNIPAKKEQVRKCEKCGHTLIDSKDVNFQLQDVVPYLHCKKRIGANGLDFFVSATTPTPEEIKKIDPKLLLTIGCMEKGCNCTFGKSSS